MKTVIYFILSLLIALPLSSQVIKKSTANPQGISFEDRKLNEYDNPLQREIEFTKKRAYPNESIPDNARINAIHQMEQMFHNKNSNNLALAQQPLWNNIGPQEVGGRIKSIVCHPQKEGWVYIGAAAGGIWRTTDGGNSWTPIFDFQNGIAFGSISIDVNNPDIIYAGTGEAVNGGNAYLGAGLFRSTDGGDTWNVIGLTDVGAFSKVIVHPANSNLIVAGAVKRGQGFYKSIDAGMTWTRTYQGPVSDVTINPKDQNDIVIGVTGTGILHSSDGGETWEQRNNGLDFNIGRVSVQFAPSNPDILFTLMEISGVGTIYKSTDHCQNWILAYKGQADFFNGQGFYDNYIVVHPTNPNVVLAGGIDIFQTINGFNFSNVTMSYSSSAKAHPDQHTACFDPLTPNTVYAGNDGGMIKSGDAGMNWTNINNNLQVTQFYSITVDEKKENVNYGGSQDNGTLGLDKQGNWSYVMGGDGFQTVVGQENTNLIFGEFIQQIGNGTTLIPWKHNISNNSASVLSNGIDFSIDGAGWDLPLVMDPNNNSTLYHGRKRLYVSYNSGDKWAPLKTPATQGEFSAIGLSIADENVIYAGTEFGELIVSDDGGSHWSLVSENGTVNRWITDIECSSTDAGIAYVTFSGFGTPHVYKTTNYGQSWKNISNGLPDIPTNAIAIYPDNENMLFIGTDIGVFATFDGGNSWLPYGRGLPRSPVLGLKFNSYFSGDVSIPLRAATHGRSMWQVDVTSESITDPEILSPAGAELYTSTTSQVLSWYGFNPPVRVEYSVDNGVNWDKIAENVQGSSLVWNVPNKPTINARIRVTSMNDANQVRVSNTFTILLINIGSVMKLGGVSYIPYGLCYDGKNSLWSTSFQTNKLTKLNSESFLKEKDITLPGDSLYSDLTMDRKNGILYIHRMNSTQGNGGIILVVDTNGTQLWTMKSPATNYPIGLELVDGKLIVGDRDMKDDNGYLILQTIDPQSGALISQTPNPFQRTYGPRGLCYDGKQYLYQVCTDFPNASSLTAAYIQQIDKSDLSTEVSRFSLEGIDGIINGRGIDYDPRDDNFWVSDYGGNLYKIAGFFTIVSVPDENNMKTQNGIEAKIYPNPMTDFTTVSYKLLTTGSRMKVEIINVLGQNVGTLFDNYVGPGESNYLQIKGESLNNGVYWVVFSLEGKRAVSMRLDVLK